MLLIEEPSMAAFLSQELPMQLSGIASHSNSTLILFFSFPLYVDMTVTRLYGPKCP